MLLTNSFQEISTITVPAGNWLVQAKGVSLVASAGSMTCDLMAGPSFIADRVIPYLIGTEVHAGFALINVVNVTQPTQVFLRCKSDGGTTAAVEDTKLVALEVR